MATNIPFTSTTPIFGTLSQGFTQTGLVTTILAVAYSAVAEVPIAIKRIVRRIILDARAMAAALTLARLRFAAGWSMPPALGSLAVVLAWASFLLAPGSAHAQATPSSSLPSWLVTAAAGVGLAVTGGLGLLAFHQIAPRVLTWLAGAGIKRAEAVAEEEIASTSLSTNAEALAVVDHQVESLGDDFSAALLEAAKESGSLSVLSLSSLEQVGKNAISAFMAKVDKAALLSALEQLGQLAGGDVLAWAKSKVAGLIHSHVMSSTVASVPAPVVAPTTKIVLTTADGTKIVAPAPAAS